MIHPPIQSILTLRSAPALELNLVAVTTLLFLGSTAPTATSGVTTTATSFGGAVKIAARPNLIANPSAPTAPLGDNGVPERGTGDNREDKDVPGVARESRPLEAFVGLVENPGVDCRRWGVRSADVDRESDARICESMALRARLDGGVGEDNRVLLVVGDAMLPSVVEGFSSPSFHCRWRMTDFVAH